MNLLTAPRVLGSFHFDDVVQGVDVRAYEPPVPVRIAGIDVTVELIGDGLCWLIRDEYDEPVAVFQRSYVHWAIVLFTYSGPAAESVLFFNRLDHGSFADDAQRRGANERFVAVFHDGLRPKPLHLIGSSDWAWGYVVGLIPAEFLEAPKVLSLVPPLCIHELIGCATCAGTDDLAPVQVERPGRDWLPWTEAEDAVARDRSLSSRQVAEKLGRTVSAVSAHRLGVLRMKGGWPGYVAKPGRSRRRLA